MRQLIVSLIVGLSIGYCAAGGPLPGDGGDSPFLSVASAQNYSEESEAILETGWWGPGNYMSITKILLYLVLFFLWVHAANWMNKDAETLELPSQARWNTIYFLTFTLIWVVTLFIPSFFAGYPLALLAYIVPLGIYIHQRNQLVLSHEKVLTGEHLRFVMASMLKKAGIKMKVRKTYAYEGGPPVRVESTSFEDHQKAQAQTILARNKAQGFNAFRKILADALFRQSDAVRVDCGPEETVVRQQIDGVWHEFDRLDREESDLMIESIKILIGADPEERRKRQEGSLLAVYEKTQKYDADIVFQGSKTGERLLVQFKTKETPFEGLEDLGMREQLREKLKSHLNASEGLVIFSAPPANGLKSTLNVAVRTADRFTRDFAAVEDVHHRYEEVENVPVTLYDSQKGQSPIDVLGDVFFREPQVVVIRDLVNTESLQLCCEEIDNERLIITSLRSREATETLLRALAMKIPPELFASKVSVVIFQKLIRKLCPDCKEAYQPSPKLLQKLGLPKGKVKELYRVRSEPEEGEKQIPCPTCYDIGYAGRTAIFEILEITDELRKAMVTAPKPDNLRQAARKSGHKGLTFEGTLLVAKGVTSVEELMRVLKS